MKKFICSFLMLLLLGAGSANAMTVEYKFAGTFTEGEGAGSDFSGWFTYDPMAWGAGLPTELEVCLSPHGNPQCFAERYPDAEMWKSGGLVDVQAKPQIGQLASLTYWTRINWADPMIEPGDLIPLDRITSSVFEWEFTDNFGVPIDTSWRGSGPLNELRQVPEPTTMLLLGIGLIGLAGWSRRKFK
jgi:hypothetical protein